MRTSPWILFAALLLTSVTVSGCLQTCEQLCVENARYVEGCLESWEAMWADLGYDGRVTQPDGTFADHEQGPAGEYVDTCVSRYGAATSRSGAEVAREIREGCSEDLQLLAASANCDDYQPNDLELDPTQD